MCKYLILKFLMIVLILKFDLKLQFAKIKEKNKFDLFNLKFKFHDFLKEKYKNFKSNKNRKKAQIKF
ncbi:hypothetical protein BpHYR1_005803 [Brachionus plicatilis]|uniref:Uncharacterized protein n=1 Tax=Brachionus plicatilis TaxID=10195 RepID=A0A3M7QDR4_BRAPC|nr:hypothetical protein BpHYR1_005803 [Brachionus plicatilis]